MTRLKFAQGFLVQLQVSGCMLFRVLDVQIPWRVGMEISNGCAVWIDNEGQLSLSTNNIASKDQFAIILGWQ